MNILNIVETLTIVVSVATIGFIIMNQPQQGDTYGASTSFTQTRRGFEKQIYNLAVASSVVLFILVLISQILK